MRCTGEGVYLQCIELWGNDSCGRAIRLLVDDTARTLVVSQLAEHCIALGECFWASYYALVPASGTLDIAVTVPIGREVRMGLTYNTESETAFDIYEGCVFSAGAILPAVNRNRNSPNVSHIALAVSPTISSLGARLFTWRTGWGTANKKTVGGEAAIANIIMKAGSNALFRWTNASAGIACGIVLSLDWSEGEE